MTHIASRDKGDSLLFFEVICQISMSHRPKILIWIQFGQDYLAGRNYQIHQTCLVMQTMASASGVLFTRD